MLIDIIGWMLILLFLMFWLFLIYADTIIRRLTKHADVSWLFYKKSVGFGIISTNFQMIMRRLPRERCSRTG